MIKGAVTVGGGPLSSLWTHTLLVLVVKYCLLFIAFSSTKTEPESPYDKPTNDANKTYEGTSLNDDVPSVLEEVYEEIGEPSHYTELNVVRPKKETKRDTDEDDVPTEPPPEPPPLRPHQYLELVHLWGSVHGTNRCCWQQRDHSANDRVNIYEAAMAMATAMHCDIGNVTETIVCRIIIMKKL